MISWSLESVFSQFSLLNSVALIVAISQSIVQEKPTSSTPHRYEQEQGVNFNIPLPRMKLIPTSSESGVGGDEDEFGNFMQAPSWPDWFGPSPILLLWFHPCTAWLGVMPISLNLNPLYTRKFVARPGGRPRLWFLDYVQGCQTTMYLDRRHRNSNMASEARSAKTFPWRLLGHGQLSFLWSGISVKNIQLSGSLTMWWTSETQHSNQNRKLLIDLNGPADMRRGVYCWGFSPAVGTRLQ